MVDLLLDHGADIDARDVDHYSTPAQWAANNRPELALHLASRGAEPDIFMLVAALDRNRISQFLADNPGALFERISTVRFPPPAEHPDVRCIYFFTPSMGPNATPLHVAAVKNSVQVVDLLIEAGLGVDTRGGYDEATPLHLAGWNGSIQAAKRLLELGAEIDARSGKLHNNTPLGWAIVSGSVASVQFLLEQGARVFDFHPKEAATGVAGRFREYSQASLEDWKVIQELLSQQSGAR